MTSRRNRLGGWLLASGAALGSAAPVGAESAFSLAYPDALGPVAAHAFDDAGHVLPLARLANEADGSDGVRIQFEAGDPGGARMLASARLEAIPGLDALRLVEQRSVSYTPDGQELRSIEIDHTRRRARCLGPGGRLLEEVTLEARDRVVNVPMHLFFLPLVRGEQKRLEFDLFLCRGGGRRVAFEAWVDSVEDPRGVRVRYAPDLGVASILARRLAPMLSFWFDPKAPHAWRGHRLPLYTNGPEVVVLRDPRGRLPVNTVLD